jgi:hypothetical protein
LWELNQLEGLERLHWTAAVAGIIRRSQACVFMDGRATRYRSS